MAKTRVSFSLPHDMDMDSATLLPPEAAETQRNGDLQSSQACAEQSPALVRLGYFVSS